MNCTNCGFTNKPEDKKCIKCNTSLIASPENKESSHRADISTDNSGVSRTIRGQQPIEAFIDSTEAPISNISKTIRGEQPKEPFIDLLSNNSPSNCPHCGFQLFTSNPLCPNCNNDINKASSSGNAPKNYTGTIDPYSKKVFSLRPIVNGEPDTQKFEFQGSTELNRDNTLKDNKTITSNVQAEIKFENGEWFLLDRSEQQTTFIRPGSPIKLNKGDIILLGDTKFVFDK